ncbi:aldehyde dehydrogenase [Chromobacterium subtsugae]|uniref:Aldehyde dehydrogenase n=1 Tax=Chromobacterium subtsugae TaxID=251747 RepID=A0ABS7F982_9NEIS|nr:MULTISPECIES: aldehyde dehydrogenase [Chromobacterium]KUM02608.1 aldehyde dehydrogenase [Chromobacterium subtsugae]KZE87994.1 aldehyde dehydrogenase [Chromobacterium sp. F49]MBW7565495.1 aldehyde dehydrogenase [Chromobacterium subtsugae]MBW8286655.1 aldehyde dehydrogenase [Chromobacterium subtsugae]WSE90862.1 aldehyde dehydrogenase [Chromobacterium subtsugae]
MSTGTINWQKKAEQLHFEGRAYIDGAYRKALSGKEFTTINPATGKVLASIEWCGEEDVELAVRAARRAFDGGAWSELAPRSKMEILKRFASLIQDNIEELALLESLDVGKPIANALSVDISNTAYCISWFAELIDKVPGEVVPVDPALLGMVTREPVGVVAAIVPWNFPLLMASWKFAPALAAGNAVILKPSEKSPLTAIRIAALAEAAGIPPGIFQVLPGAGNVGQALASHLDVDCVAFTGSTAVGKQIANYAAQSNLKRVWLELGGKSPNIILADCKDLKAAARAAAGAICYNAGQMCTAGSRVLVAREIREAFLSELKVAMADYRPGDPLSPETNLGAVVDQRQFDKVLSYIAQGQKEGATLLQGGAAVQAIHPDGLFIEPAIFDCPQPNLTICREEIFGPVLSVITFDDVDEAVRIANDSQYGLGAAVWTQDVSTAHKVARQLRAGTVWVNCYEEGGDMNLPFGGYKQSGNGRDKSLHALEKYTELKSTLIKL